MDRIWFDEYKKTGIQNEITLPPENTSLIDLFESSFQKYGSRDAFIFMDQSITYTELELESRKFACYLQSLGIQKGARVAIMMPNVLQYPVVVSLGVIRAGCILVNVNPLYTARELEHQLNDAGVETLVIIENFASVYEKILGKTPVKHVVVASVGDMLGLIKGTIVNFVLRKIRKQIPKWNIPGAVSFNDAQSRVDAKQYKRPVLTLDDTVVLQYTGGTTGVAKGAELTHRNLVANMLQIRNLFDSKFKTIERVEYRFVAALPLYHIFAFTLCELYALCQGATNLLIPNPRDLPALVKEVGKFKPTLFPAVNTLFNALIHNEEFKQLDHSNMLIAVGGGMAVLPSTAAAWKKYTGIIIHEGYGLSETSPAVVFNPPVTTEFSGCIGIPIPSTDAALLDDDGKAVQIGEQGEICIRGPQVMKGYWNRPEETKEVMTADGFFRTGDIGVMDERGYIKIVDRKKDMILVSGFNVYPNEIEEVIATHPKVLEVAAVGITDEKSGEVPKIFVVKKDDSLTTEEILAYAKENLTGYKRPRYVEFMPELPKSNVGKILRKELRKHG